MSEPSSRKPVGLTLARWLLAGLALSVLALLAGAAGDARAAGAIEITSFDAALSDYQAGGHPDASVEFSLATEPSTNPPGSCGLFFPADCMAVKGGTPKDVHVKLPEGIFGNPQTVTDCSVLVVALGRCPVAAQVGVAEVGLIVSGTVLPPTLAPAALYSVPPDRGMVAKFAFRALSVTTVLSVKLRNDGTYVLATEANNIYTGLPLHSSKVTIWGVPYAAENDSHRCEMMGGVGGLCTGTPGTSSGPNSVDAEPLPFLVAPSECGVDGFATMRVRSYQHPGDDDWVSATSSPQQVTGCDRLTFNPTVSAKPTTTRADAATGFDVDLHFPQHFDSPSGVETPPLKDAIVELPEGMSINPSSADGLDACSDRELALNGDRSVACPAASKIGTVEATTPVLEERLSGGVFLRPQISNDPESGEMFRIALVLENEERGLSIRLPGEVRADSDTGQVSATFRDNPQLPVSDIGVHFKTGPRAPLATPRTCGVKTTTATLTSWAGQSVQLTDSFVISKGPNGGGCVNDLAARPFSPEMNAGVTNPVAGSFSPFIFRLTRQDGHQEILTTTLTPPKGVTAKLAGVPLCTSAQANAGACPAASQIGEVIVGAGAGPSPFYIQPPNEGHVYMTEGYRGQQLGMLIQVPAKAGPFDLGLVNVRAAVHVNKHTAQLRVISDPIPQILEGIPLRTKDIRVKINRPSFTIAPTNCDPMAVNATVEGSHGAVANLTNRFQVGDCASLGFNPKLKLDFGKRRKSTRRNAHPPLHANLNFNPGDANISYVQVALPKGVFLDQARLGRICSRANYAAETCPAESRVGYAKATTPLLDNPVEGPVYLKSSDNPLPDLAADLNGQIDIDLFGKIDQKENRKGVAQIRNTFDVVPDVPVSHFELTLDGGDDGLLVNSENICKSRRTQRVGIKIEAHNEMSLKQRPRIGSACKKLNRKKAKRLKKRVKQLKRKAREAEGNKRAKKLRKKAKKLKRQYKKLKR